MRRQASFVAAQKGWKSLDYHLAPSGLILVEVSVIVAWKMLVDESGALVNTQPVTSSGQRGRWTQRPDGGVYTNDDPAKTWPSSKLFWVAVQEWETQK